MRELIRASMRAETERKEYKPSAFVRSAFDHLQKSKYGATHRKICQARGTHKRKNWSMSIASVLGQSSRAA